MWSGGLRVCSGQSRAASLRTRLDKLEARQKKLRTEIEAAGAPPAPVQLHPNAAEIYRAKVAELEAALNDPEIKAEASEALRALIERIVLTPDADAPQGLRVELYGDLAMILRLGNAQPLPKAGNTKLPGTGVLGSQLSVVAGARNPLYRTAIRWPALRSGHVMPVALPTVG